LLLQQTELSGSRGHMGGGRKQGIAERNPTAEW
jgi:hypothetical protein